MYRSLLLLACLLAALPVQAQSPAQSNRFSIGPQITSLGIGVSGSYRVMPRLSLSAEANLLPLGSRSAEIEDIEYEADLQVSGGLLLVNYHPGSGNFSLGAGLLVGGYGLDGMATPTEPVEIGGQTYAPGQVGTLEGTLSARGPVPVFVLGWRGRGFNFGFGVTTGYAAKVDLQATGPIASDPGFRQSVEDERQNIRDAVDRVPVLPYLRLGWQFGF